MAGLDDAGRAGVGTTRKDAPETNLENTSATGAQHDMYGREGGTGGVMHCSVEAMALGARQATSTPKQPRGHGAQAGLQAVAVMAVRCAG